MTMTAPTTTKTISTRWRKSTLLVVFLAMSMSLFTGTYAFLLPSSKRTTVTDTPARMETLRREYQRRIVRGKRRAVTERIDSRLTSAFTRLWGSSADFPPRSSSNENEDTSTPWGRNKARMDFRYFLTQRSIQSFVYLLKQCREEYTIQYLEVSQKHLRKMSRCLLCYSTHNYHAHAFASEENAGIQKY